MKQVMRKSLLMAALVAIAFLASCTTGFGPQGGLFTSTKIGVYADDVSKTDLRGEACSMSILGLIAIGDGSVEAAASGAGINKVNSVDLESFSILGIYARLCSVVRGQ